MVELERVAYHRARAQQERERANRSPDKQARHIHTELALAHEQAASTGGHRLRAVHDL